MRWVNFLVEKYRRFRWSMLLRSARSVCNAHCECGLGYTPGWENAAREVYHLEWVGIHNGWMGKDERTMKRRNS